MYSYIYIYTAAHSTGPSSPTTPMSLTVSMVNHQSASFEWVVMTVAYDNESYIVTYGLDSNDLSIFSATQPGSSDISLTNSVRQCVCVCVCVCVRACVRVRVYVCTHLAGVQYICRGSTSEDKVLLSCGVYQLSRQYPIRAGHLQHHWCW